jgi:hypothetical protein
MERLPGIHDTLGVSLPLRLIRECFSSCRSILYVPDKDNLSENFKE